MPILRRRIPLLDIPRCRIRPPYLLDRGRDIRLDVNEWYQRVTIAEILGFGLRLGLATATAAAARLVGRKLQRLWPRLEDNVTAWIGLAPGEKVVRRISSLLYWYTITIVRLVAVWFVVRLLVQNDSYDQVFGLAARILTFLVFARMLTLSSRVLLHVLCDIGNRYLLPGKFSHYWQSVTRLVPFGERCLDAVVYIFVAVLCLSEVESLRDMVRQFGPKLITCIGIVFATRVLIELFQVLLRPALRSRLS